MKSTVKGNVSYQVLQRLTEQAWDAQDWERLAHLSAAVDRLALELLKENCAGQQPLTNTQ